MHKQETLIVLTNYLELVSQFTTTESRMRWGVLCTPVLLGGKYCLPLGWSDELDAANVEYTIELVEWFEEEL